MTSRKFPRIEIDQKAYDGLQIEAVLQHRTVREIATEAILGSISREALSVLDHKTTMPEDIATKRPLDHKTIEETCRTEGEAVVCDVKKKRLADNPDALARVKELWHQTPRPSFVEMSRVIGYPKSTVAENIKRMKEKGELPI